MTDRSELEVPPQFDPESEVSRAHNIDHRRLAQLGRHLAEMDELGRFLRDSLDSRGAHFVASLRMILMQDLERVNNADG